MFEDFDGLNNQKQGDEDDSESSSSYSFPSYSRFTYTGKTKSRLGRNRFLRQTGGKEETKKPEEENSGTLGDFKSNNLFLQSNNQPPKTPNVGWLQRESSQSTHPFTPSGNSKSVYGSFPELSSAPSQSNFLFNLKNDSAQSSNCKRNLPFSTTPFKTKMVPAEQQSNDKPLKELKQLIKPENPFSKLDFFGRTKEENKENSLKAKTEGKNNDFDPSWNQLKKIADAAVPFPSLPASERNKMQNDGNLSDPRKTKETSSSNFFAHLNVERKDEKKDDDSADMPLDLSSADSTTSKTLFIRSLMSGSDQVDGDSSSSLNRPLKDLTNELIAKRADDSTAQKTNTDALSGFLPKFLVPKNKNQTSPDKDEEDSPNSLVTMVERKFEFKPQISSQKSQITLQPTIKIPTTGDNPVETSKNEIHSSSQYKSVINSEVKKPTSEVPVINFINKDPSPCPRPNANNDVRFQVQFHNNTNQKYSPPSVPLEPPKLSPPNSVPDFRSLVNDGQNLLKQEQNQYPLQSVNSNVHPMKNESEINSLALNFDTNLGLGSKSANDQMNQRISDKNVNQFRCTNISTNEICPTNQFKTDMKPAELINPLVNNQHIPVSSSQVPSSEPMNTLYSGVRHEPRPIKPGLGERNSDQLVHQSNIPKPVVMDQRDPAIFRQQENIQPALHSQKTYLAPQQPSDRNNASDFPHVKPEIPLLGGSKPSFPAMKKPNHFKMSALRGMPSRADTELSVNGKSYTILSMLGKGGSSEVYQVLDSCTSKLLAVKCVDLSMVDKTIADGYLNEIDLLSRLQGCDSVIRMFDYEYMQECKMLYVVMEKGDTDLSHLIRDISKTKKISMSMIIYYWTEMLQAVKDIHDQGIIHSDLKPANFLLVSGRLKLIDFGIASSQGDMTSVVKEVTTGTWNYMSPEAIKNTSASGKGFKITYKSDVWSLGCILYNLVYGKTPFSHITNTWGKLTAIADPNHCIQFPEVGAPAVLFKALQSCFHRDPKLRPTVAELLTLPYHSTGDGNELINVGRQVKEKLPAQEWAKIAHLFPGVKSNQEGKVADNSG